MANAKTWYPSRDDCPDCGSDETFTEGTIVECNNCGASWDHE